MQLPYYTMVDQYHNVNKHKEQSRIRFLEIVPNQVVSETQCHMVRLFTLYKKPL